MRIALVHIPVLRVGEVHQCIEGGHGRRGRGRKGKGEGRRAERSMSRISWATNSLWDERGQGNPPIPTYKWMVHVVIGIPRHPLASDKFNNYSWPIKAAFLHFSANTLTLTMNQVSRMIVMRVESLSLKYLQSPTSLSGSFYTLS